VVRQLEQGPYILSDTLSGADVIWGIALDWLTKFGLVPHGPEIDAYVARVLERPAVARASEIDQPLQKPKS
jgi:glutathione S-transferase